MSKKVYFINRIPINGCSYVRTYLPQLLNDFNGCAINMCEIKDIGIASHECLNSDVIVFYRPTTDTEYELAKLLKENGKKIVFDNDDTYKAESPISLFMKKNYQKENDDKCKKFCELADLISVSTEELKKEYEKELPNKKVVVLENCMYKEHFPLEIEKNNTDKIRVGLVGSCIFSTEWKIIEPLLKDILKDNKHKLVVFGMSKNTKTKCFDGIIDELMSFGDVEINDGVDIGEYYQRLNELKLDYLLIPREENYFNYCKSNIKFLEAGMLEIPCIVSSFKNNNSPYDKLPDDTCIKCKTLEDWYNAVKILDDKNNRIKYGKTARKYVLDNYNIEKRYKEWRNAYNQLFK